MCFLLVLISSNNSFGDESIKRIETEKNSKNTEQQYDLKTDNYDSKENDEINIESDETIPIEQHFENDPNVDEEGWT